MRGLLVRHFTTSLLMIPVIMSAMIDRVLREALASGIAPGSVFVSSQAHVEPRFFGWADVRFMPWIAALVLGSVVVWCSAAFGCRVLRWADARAVALIALIVSATNNTIDRFRFGGVWDYWGISAFGG